MRGKALRSIYRHKPRDLDLDLDLCSIPFGPFYVWFRDVFLLTLVGEFIVLCKDIAADI